MGEVDLVSELLKANRLTIRVRPDAVSVGIVRIRMPIDRYDKISTITRRVSGSIRSILDEIIEGKVLVGKSQEVTGGLTVSGLSLRSENRRQTKTKVGFSILTSGRPRGNLISRTSGV